MRRLLLMPAVMVASGLVLGGCKKDKEKEPEGAAPPAAAAKSPEANGANNGAAGKNAAAPAPQNPQGCNSDLSGEIKASYTLTEKCSPYTLDHDLSADGWDLTIEPGVTIKFAEGGHLTAGWSNDGRLTANGTVEKPIRFVSGARQEPGAWRGILLADHADGSSLKNVVIENAGRDDNPAIRITSKDIHLAGVQVVGSKSQAFLLEDAARVVEFDGNDFTKAGTHEVIGTFSFPSLGGIKAATNKWPSGSVLQVEGDTLDTDMAVINPGIPFRILHNVSVDSKAGASATLTIGPGVVFQMAEDTRWSFGWTTGGAAKFKGTAAEPIVFTRFGDAMDKGSWRGFAFSDHTHSVEMDHVNIEYAGPKEQAAVEYGKPRTLGKLTHVKISKALGSAILTDNNGCTFEAFSDNVFEDVGQPALRLKAETATNLGANNTYPKGAVIDLSDSISQDTTLTAQAAPYQMLGKLSIEGQSEVALATLTIAPGATLEFGSEGSLGVGWSNPGVLVAVGSADKPITFTGALDSWKGIQVHKGKAQVENASFDKVASDQPALAFDKGTTGDVKALKFTAAIKVPLRDCTEGSLQVNEVKGVKDGC